jgi:thiamine biosynthesis lipoprotein ApbE
MIQRALTLVALALVPAVTEAATVERARYLMGTVCEVAVENGHEAEIDAAFAEAKRVESMLSTWTVDSELARVNRGEAPGEELRALLEKTLAWKQRTNGAFDPQLGRVIKRVACAKEVCWEEGAFGKGYALDRMLTRIGGETAMINFGGQILARGELRVFVADQKDRQKAVVAFTMRDASLSTSSNSEQKHLIDPRTGQLLPARGSASVIADDALTADILSTALYVLGEDDGLRWADANDVAAIFIDAAHHIRFSAKARERVRGLELLDRKFSLKE